MSICIIYTDTYSYIYTSIYKDPRPGSRVAHVSFSSFLGTSSVIPRLEGGLCVRCTQPSQGLGPRVWGGGGAVHCTHNIANRTVNKNNIVTTMLFRPLQYHKKPSCKTMPLLRYYDSGPYTTTLRSNAGGSLHSQAPPPAVGCAQS